ncbi:MAG: hypothetical protein ACI4ND_06995 [Succinivibrio sp.]
MRYNFGSLKYSRDVLSLLLKIEDRVFSKALIQKSVLGLSVLLAVYCIYAVLNLIAVAQMSGDDLSFFKNQIISFSFIEHRFLTWTSRFIVDTAAVFFCQHVFLFKLIFVVLIALVFLLKLSLYIKANFKQKYGSFELVMFSALITTLYPYYALHSAGFVDTSVIFAFPFIMMFVASYLLFTDVQDRVQKSFASSACTYFSFIISSVIACNNEMSMLFLLVCSIYKIRSIKGKILFFIAVASFLYTVFCPGNQARIVSNIDYYLPEFVNFTVFEKLYIGVTKTLFQILYINKVPFIILLSLLVLIKTRSITVCVAAYFILKRISRYFAHQLDAANINEHNWISNFPIDVLAVMVSLCVFVVFIILSLDISKKDKFESAALFILGFGIASSIGLSPSVFASNDRPGYIAQALIIYCALNIIRCQYFINYNKDTSNFSFSRVYLIKTLLIVAVLSAYNISVNY